ncbi:MAG: MATE family efflux transporter [Brevinematia bacterium]
MKNEILKRMALIGFPLMLQMIVQYIFSFTDMAFVGNYDSNGLSALTNVMAPYFIFLYFFYAISQGLAILISNNIGAQKINIAIRFGENAVFFNQILSLFYFVFWFFLGRYVLILMGAKGEVLKLSENYIKILSFSFLTFGLGSTAGGVLQGIGKTIPIFVIIFFKTALNIFLNWTLIFGKFGLPEFGVSGSALGSAISNIVGDIVGFIFIMSQKEFKLRIGGIFKPSFSLFKRMVFLGVPMGMAGLLWQLGQALLLFMLNQINQVYSGYVGVISNIVQMTVTFYWGAAMSVMILISEYRGRNQTESISLINKYGLLYSLLICVIFSLLFLTFPHSFFRIFITEGSKIKELISLVPFIILIVFPKACNVIFDQSIRGLGDSKWVMNLQIFGTIYIVFLGFLFILNLKLGVLGALLAVAFDEITRLFIYVYRFYIKEKNIKLKKI